MAPKAPPGSSGSLSKSLVDPNKVYKFRTCLQTTLASSGLGVIQAAMPFDPTLVPFPEYGDLSALFDMVRVRRAKITFYPVNPHADASVTFWRPAAVSCDLGLSNITPTSYAAVIDCPNSKFIGNLMPDSLSVDIRNNEFARTIAPAPGPYAGCWGQFQIYAASLSGGTTYYAYMLELVLEFTSRT